MRLNIRRDAEFEASVVHRMFFSLFWAWFLAPNQPSTLGTIHLRRACTANFMVMVSAVQLSCYGTTGRNRSRCVQFFFVLTIDWVVRSEPEIDFVIPLRSVLTNPPPLRALSGACSGVVRTTRMF